jgi:hypothetical protein
VSPARGRLASRARTSWCQQVLSRSPSLSSLVRFCPFPHFLTLPSALSVRPRPRCRPLDRSSPPIDADPLIKSRSKSRSPEPSRARAGPRLLLLDSPSPFIHTPPILFADARTAYSQTPIRSLRYRSGLHLPIYPCRAGLVAGGSPLVSQTRPLP